MLVKMSVAVSNFFGGMIDTIGNFLDEFTKLENISDDLITPGRKRLLKKQKEEIDWDINQDIDAYSNLNEGDRVFHQKFGYGRILYIEGDKAEVDFEKSSQKQVFLKYLQFIN